jgi:hypothetical protein
MDKTIRKNEICTIGLPRCDFVFSSTRSCFIAYGFDESSLEMDLLKKLLEERGIQPVEAGGSLAPAQSAFCAKICSKIITSQFCIALINNDNINGIETPNANVNMEYGLMLGFNKYVIPFQRESQKLPFNVAGLDTIKYNNKNFAEKSISAIDQAIKTTNQDDVPKNSQDQFISLFLLSRNYLWADVENEGERNFFKLGNHLGFNLLNDFSGNNYVFLGQFTTLRSEMVLWRLRKLNEILNGRMESLPLRAAAGVINQGQLSLAQQLFKTFQLWIIVTSNDDKNSILKELTRQPLNYKTDIISLDDVFAEIKSVIAI